MTDLRICSADGCARPSRTKGLCSMHYNRLWMTGSIELKERPRPVQEHFWNVVVPYKGSDCLIWPFARNRAGYGVVFFDGRYRLASRSACIVVHGDPPAPDSQAAHSCGNGNIGCVNPMHLRWASPAENQRDRLSHGTDGRGERNSNAKLDAPSVKAIKAALLSGRSQADIAKEFGVTFGAISAISLGRNWSHV